MGRFDDLRYLEEMKKEFKPKNKLTKDQFNKALLGTKEQIQAVISKKFDLDDSELKQLNEKIK